MKDISSILDFIKKSSIFDIFLVSFVLLPFILETWMSIFKGLGYDNSQLSSSIFIIIVIYAVGVIFMYDGIIRSKNKEIAKDQIIGYLQSKNFRMMSFNRIREKINKTYQDDFLIGVVNEFPQQLRHAILKGGVKGVALLLEESGSGIDT